MLLLSSADFFQNLKKKQKKQHHFQKPFRVPNGLDPGQDRHFVGSGLGPNCLQRLLADGQKKMLNVVNENKPLLWVLHAVCFLLSKSHGKTSCCHTVRRCAVTW